MYEKNQPLVSIVVVNYNGQEFLEGCFGSLSSMDYPPEKLELIVVDNGSDDGSIELVRERYPDVILIENDANNYCKANNLGIRRSSGEFIGLLNNDLTVSRNWLMELVRELSKSKKIGAVGPKVLFKGGRIQSTGLVELPNFYWAERGRDETDGGQYDRLEEVYALNGVSILYKRACLDDVGLLDEDFVMYVEEIDMAHRLREKGWKRVYVPTCQTYHEFKGTTRRDPYLFDYYTQRNRMLYIAKHFPHELAEALSSSIFFYDGIIAEHKMLFDTVQAVVDKVVKEHDQKTVSEVLPEFFREIRRLVDFENYDMWGFRMFIRPLLKAYLWSKSYKSRSFWA